MQVSLRHVKCRPYNHICDGNKSFSNCIKQRSVGIAALALNHGDWTLLSAIIVTIGVRRSAARVYQCESTDAEALQASADQIACGRCMRALASVCEHACTQGDGWHGKNACDTFWHAAWRYVQTGRPAPRDNYGGRPCGRMALLLHTFILKNNCSLTKSCIVLMVPYCNLEYIVCVHITTAK